MQIAKDQEMQKKATKDMTRNEIDELFKQRLQARKKVLTTSLEVFDFLDMRNTQTVADFVPSIMKYLYTNEKVHQYPSNFLQNQSEINDKLRAYLIDWLSELHYKYKFKPETLYVTVGIIDKFFMYNRDVKKNELQCLGVTAFHIAGKYEEIYPPDLKSIIKMTANALT